jgi:hypothetical protein
LVSILNIHFSSPFRGKGTSLLLISSHIYQISKYACGGYFGTCAGAFYHQRALFVPIGSKGYDVIAAAEHIKRMVLINTLQGDGCLAVFQLTNVA